MSDKLEIEYNDIEQHLTDDEYITFIKLYDAIMFRKAEAAVKNMESKLTRKAVKVIDLGLHRNDEEIIRTGEQFGFPFRVEGVSGSGNIFTSSRINNKNDLIHMIKEFRMSFCKQFEMIPVK